MSRWAEAFSWLFFWAFVLACIVLTAGTPDLLDAIIKQHMECKQ